MSERVYRVWSTYKTTGVAHILASSKAEAERIAVDGYPSGHMPLFDFSEPHSETRMRSEAATDGEPASRAEDLRGDYIYPVPATPPENREEQNR